MLDLLMKQLDLLLVLILLRLKPGLQKLLLLFESIYLVFQAPFID